MKKLLLLIFPVLLMIRAEAQTPYSFQNDTTYKSDHFEGLKLVNQHRLNDYDFQLRFITGDGLRIISKVYYLIITYDKGKWSAMRYTFIGEAGHSFMGKITIDSSDIHIDSYPSLFRQLAADSLFSLHSIDGMDIMRLQKARGDSEISIVMDGGGYAMELLSPMNKRKVTYSNPVSYYKATHLTELQRPVAIITKLIEVMGMKDHEMF